MIASSVYKLPASAYMRELIGVWLYARWYTVVLPVVPFIGLSFVNLNFVYVSLMMLFIVIPMVLAYVYFYYALSEECAESIRRCRVELHQDCLVRFYISDDDEEFGRKEYPWDCFDSYEVSASMLRLDLKGKKFGFQLISLSALREGSGSLAGLYSLLDNKIGI